MLQGFQDTLMARITVVKCTFQAEYISTVKMEVIKIINNERKKCLWKKRGNISKRNFSNVLGNIFSWYL